jgi:predicted nuclease with TOPRIM domain
MTMNQEHLQKHQELEGQLELHQAKIDTLEESTGKLATRLNRFGGDTIETAFLRLENKIAAIEASLHGEDHEQRKRWEELDERNECPKDVERPGEPSGLIHDVHELAMAVGNLVSDAATMRDDVAHQIKRVDRHASRLAAIPEGDMASRAQLDEALDKHARAMHQRIGDLTEKLKGISADDLASAVRWALKYKREVERKLAMPSRFEALMFGLTGRNGRR